MSDDQQKRCNICGRFYPATTAYFNTKTTASDGLTKGCSRCLLAVYTPKPPKPAKQIVEKPARPKRSLLIDSVLHLRCANCREYKPATDEFFYRDKREVFGFSGYCRPCHNAKRDESRARKRKRTAPENEQRRKERELERDNRRQAREKERLAKQRQKQQRREQMELEKSETEALYQRGEKRCKGCRRIYPLESRYFRRHKRAEDGFSPLCRECSTVHLKGSEHAETAHKQMLIRVNDELWAQQQSQIDARRRALRKRIERKYRSSPKGKAVEKAQTHKKRARKLSLPNTLTSAQWSYALDYFGHCCAVCGKREGLFETLAMDHWIPLSYSGSDNPGTVAENAVPLCHTKTGELGGGCNNRKGNKRAHDWLVAEFGERKARQIENRIETYFRHLRQNKRADAA